MNSEIESNPYLLLELAVLDAFTPHPSSHYETRIAVLLAFLSYLIVASTILLVLVVISCRRRDRPLYLCKLVHRPQGTYILLNQYLIAPTVLFSVSIFWMVYVITIRQWWITQVDNPNIAFWICLGTILPLLIVEWFITYAVLGAANLASSRKSDPSKHILGPRMIHLTTLLLPLSIAAAVVFAHRTNQAYNNLQSVAELIYYDSSVQAATYNGSTVPSDVQATLQQLLMGMNEQVREPWIDFDHNYRNSVVCLIVGLALIFIVNVAGWFIVLRQLRLTETSMVVTRDAPVVAPLQLFTTIGSKRTDSEFPEIAQVMTDAEWLGVAKTEEVEVRGRSLDWDITIFYFSVPCTIIVLMVFSIWLAIKVNGIFQENGPQLEAECLAVIWVAVPIAALATTAKCVVRIRQLLNPIQRARKISTAAKRRSLNKRSSFASRPQSGKFDEVEEAGVGIEITINSVREVTYANHEEHLKGDEESDRNLKYETDQEDMESLSNASVR